MCRADFVAFIEHIPVLQVGFRVGVAWVLGQTLHDLFVHSRRLLTSDVTFKWREPLVSMSISQLFADDVSVLKVLLTSLLRGITNWTASSLSFSDGTRGSGNAGLGAVSFFSRPKRVCHDVV